MLNRSNQLYALEKRYREIKNYQAQDNFNQINANLILLSINLSSVNMDRNNSIKNFTV